MAAEEYKERLRNTGRNDACPCGSGKKYKKCHLQEDEGKRSKDMAKAAEEAAARAAEEEAKDGEEGEGKKDEHGHQRARKGASSAPKPKPKPATVARQVSTPRKAGTS
jgi:hypothetical protein